jgi:hypothetical protein
MPNQEATGAANQECEDVRKRIMHVLTIYHEISPAMLQVGIGNMVSPRLWRPELKKLVDHGIVRQEEVTRQSPTGRYRRYTRLSLIVDCVG